MLFLFSLRGIINQSIDVIGYYIQTRFKKKREMFSVLQFSLSTNNALEKYNGPNANI